MSRLSFGMHSDKVPVILLHIEGERVSGGLAIRDCSETKPASDALGTLANTATAGATCRVPKILFSCEETFPLHRTAKPGKDMAAAAITVLKKVVDRLEKEGLQHLTFTPLGGLRSDAVGEIHCTLASPWFLSQTKIVREVKDTPELFSEKALDELVKKEANAFADAFAASEYGERFHEQLELVESHVVSLSLNGYETSRPKGKKMKELEVALYFSVVGSELLAQIREVVQPIFRRSTINFHTFPMVTFSVVRDVASVPRHFLLVDVDGEVSDFTIVKKGVAMQTITVPMGSQHFVRALEKEAGISPETALSVLGMHGLDSLSDETKKRVEPVLKKASKDWQASVSGSIALLSEECFVPGTVMVAAEDRLQPFFATLISDHSLGHGASDGTPFSVLALDCNFLNTHYQMNAPEVHSVNLLLTVLFINKLKQ